MPTYKTANKRYGKILTKLAEEIPWNKLYVDLIGPYKIRIKGMEPLILKYVTIIDPVTGWFEITQYNDKKEMTIVNLVYTTCMLQYTQPVEITYDQGEEFLGHEFKSILI